MITSPLLDLATWVARLRELEIPIFRDSAEAIVLIRRALARVPVAAP